jgi:ParB-like chromosome segregation protein Spo0J
MVMKLNDDLNATRGVTTFRIPLDKVKIKPGFNTRFGRPAPAKRAMLKESLREEGQRVPAEVWVQPDRTVVLAAGHQRYELLRELEQEDPQGRTLLCIPFTGNEEEAIRRSITENLGQTGLTLMDNVSNWDRLINKLGRPIAEVQKMYGGISAATITEGLKLLQLDRKHQQLVHEGKLSQSMALRLVRYPAEKRDVILEEMERVLSERLAKAEAAVDEVQNQIETEADEQDDTSILQTPRTLENVVTMPPPPAPKPVPVPPPPSTQSAPEPPKPRTRTVKTATEVDLLKAAENVGVQTGTEPPRKLKEVVTYLDTFLAETPKCAAVDLVKDLKLFIARKLTEAQMDNRLMKHTQSEIGEVISDPKKGKGGKK